MKDEQTKQELKLDLAIRPKPPTQRDAEPDTKKTRRVVVVTCT